MEMKASEKMLEVLRPSKGEVAKYEIKAGRDLKEIAKTIAQNKIVPAIENGAMNWKQGVEKMRDTIAKDHPRLQKLLEKQSGEVNLEDIGTKVMDGLEKRYKNAAELEEARNLVADLLLPEVQRYAGQTVPLHIANEIKSGMWQIGYDATKPLRNKIARQVGHELSDAISKQAPKLAAELNKKMSLAHDAIDVMEKATGRVVKGGRLGQYFAGGIGALAARSIPIPGAELAGYALGKKASEFLGEQGAVRGAKKAGELLEKAKSLRKSK
jgi:hypothetical protein